LCAKNGYRKNVQIFLAVGGILNSSNNNQVRRKNETM